MRLSLYSVVMCLVVSTPAYSENWVDLGQDGRAFVAVDTDSMKGVQLHFRAEVLGVETDPKLPLFYIRTQIEFDCNAGTARILGGGAYTLDGNHVFQRLEERETAARAELATRVCNIQPSTQGVTSIPEFVKRVDETLKNRR